MTTYTITTKPTAESPDEGILTVQADEWEIEDGRALLFKNADGSVVWTLDIRDVVRWEHESPRAPADAGLWADGYDQGFRDATKDAKADAIFRRSGTY